jgi:hypothetical protein
MPSITWRRVLENVLDRYGSCLAAYNQSEIPVSHSNAKIGGSISIAQQRALYAKDVIEKQGLI